MAAKITDYTGLSRGAGAGATPEQGQSQPPTARGSVRAPLPASAHDSLVVQLTPPLETITIPKGNWQPRASDGVGVTRALPAVGDTCLVVFDDLGDAWVPIFSPADL